nr:signal peptidase I [Lysinibacillus timonensis]
MKRSNFFKELWGWLVSIVIAFVCIWLVREFLFTPVAVDGASMMPTFEDGDRVIVNRIGPRMMGYDHFDVIVFEAKKDTNYIKRVIGLPGDTIEYKNDVLYINGEKYEEPYLDEYKSMLGENETLTEDFKMEEYLGETEVPEGTLFVLGDNRQYSSDSRDPRVGFVPMDKVLGKAGLVFWPFDNIGIK